MLTCFISLRITVTGMDCLDCKNWGKMLVTDTIFGRWELAVADDIYIRNGNGRNIDAQTILISIYIVKLVYITDVY